MSALLQNWTGEHDDNTIVPHHFHNGLPFEDGGFLAVDSTSAITHYHQGLPFTANGRIAVEFAAPVRFGSGSAGFTAAGRLAVSFPATPDAYTHGVAYIDGMAIIGDGQAARVVSGVTQTALGACDRNTVTVTFNKLPSNFASNETLGVTIQTGAGDASGLTYDGTSGNDVTYSWTSPDIIDNVSVKFDYKSPPGVWTDPVAGDTPSNNVLMTSCYTSPVLLSSIATTQSTIVLTFDQSLTGTEVSGITFGGATPVTLASASGLPGTTITYNINETLYNDSDVTWSYTEANGNLVRTDSAVPLEDVVDFNVNMTGLGSRPPSTTDSWALEDGTGLWELESGDGYWILE